MFLATVHVHNTRCLFGSNVWFGVSVFRVVRRRAVEWPKSQIWWNIHRFDTRGESGEDLTETLSDRPISAPPHYYGALFCRLGPPPRHEAYEFGRRVV